MPISRKGHTAVVYEDRMLVYGGYQDMRGSLGELWEFSFSRDKFIYFLTISLNNENYFELFLDSHSWKMIHSSRAKKSSEVIPPERHSHTAVVFDQGMWVYGGMTDLAERSDLWRLDLGIENW